jgi:cell division protein FtsX
MRRVRLEAAILMATVLVVTGCTGGSASQSRAREVRTIGSPDAEVFMTLHSTAAETAAVRTAIQRSPLVKSFTFVTQADALREFRRLFADQPDLIAATTADQLPASFPSVDAPR